MWPTWASHIARWVGLGPVVALTWSVLRWPVMIACVVVAVDLVYYFAPNRTCRWAWITPGSILATGLWIVSSFAFKFYVSSVAILIGAEVNGVIEQASQRAIR